MILDNVGLSLSLLKIFIQHRATLLAEQCWTVLAWFELQAISLHVCLLSLVFLERYHSVKETPSLRLLHSNLTKGRDKSIGDRVWFLASGSCWSHVGKSPQKFFYSQTLYRTFFLITFFALIVSVYFVCVEFIADFVLL
jgi:hypothetical protein